MFLTTQSSWLADCLYFGIMAYENDYVVMIYLIGIIISPLSNSDHGGSSS